MLSRMRLSARVAYVISAWLFAACVVLQVFFAGVGVLGRTGYWNPHVQLGHLLVIPILAMILFGLLGRLPRRTVWTSILLLALYQLQHVLIWGPPKLGLPMLGALHPVNALAIFFIAVHNALRYRRHLQGE